ncbi:MAG: N-6 DNA methylase [Candidatus Poribacteria bacterium]|nr:N-6 DNA methylase [Candidatus Poribacteria bacterium]
MSNLNIKPTHKPIKTYYAELKEYERLGEQNEGTVRAAFQGLLQHYCHQSKLTLLCEKTHALPTDKRGSNRKIRPDGEVVDTFKIPYGYWEAKDTQDDLHVEASKKFAAGYPSKNIVIQSPTHALLYQHGELQLDLDITDPKNLVRVLQGFFAYQEENISEWHTAVAEFRDTVPQLGEELATLIETERQNNLHFQDAFTRFHKQCQASINPNLSVAAVEEMLIQHLLTERIFRTVFDNPDFTRRNIIAREIETVIDVLTERTLNRSEFLRLLEPFYTAIERTASTITDFSQKQGFLNTVYEQFFQGFSVKVADTHGIVYTPQPIVDFMVKSVEHILMTEFNRSLSDSGVNIIDPFVGTGNFIVRIMQELDPISLERKYTADPPELQCNEVMLLPYYIANLNIEHEFYTATNRYIPYEGLCLVDTFELAEDREQLQLFTPDNTARVERQKESEMFVVIGNPPYNVGQVNANDNNQNREYETMDKRVADTYVQDSKATNKNKLYDPYVKAIRWASDRIGEEGVVAFVTNNGFLDGIAFDGMRKRIAEDFDAIYILDLGGNVRQNPKLSGTTHNVFGIQVGVSINFFIKKSPAKSVPKTANIFYTHLDEFWRKEDKYNYLISKQHCQNIEWQQITPDKRNTWLTEGLHAEFDEFIPVGTKQARAAKWLVEGVIFKTYGIGVNTNRDAWVYNFNQQVLAENVNRMIGTYNAEVARWAQRTDRETELDDFVESDDTKIKWSRNLKRELKKNRIAEYTEHKVRNSLYRPFTKSHLFFDTIMNNEVAYFPATFPAPETEKENRVICVSGIGSNKPFQALTAKLIPSLDILEKTQCFPFYIYDEDGANRRENITDWALTAFRNHYRDDTITKWDIFHYNYGLLHHPNYREKYEANLKRDLPHIPFAKDFWGFAEAGKRLAEIHVNYESQPEYDKLKFVQNPDAHLDWRVEKMKFSKDKTSLTYNDFLTLSGIPPKAHNYRLGTRSALEWIVDQYRVKTDKRSGIVNDPNRADDPQYIVKLIGQVITVSLETVDIVEGLPSL